jgi:anthranilate phosphoribosyltransferase
VERISLAALRGGEASENAAAIVALVSGEGHPALAAVVINAAAALALIRGGDLRACAEEARTAIDSQRAKQTLTGWQRAARRAKETG